jgi:hypothetical protein
LKGPSQRGTIPVVRHDKAAFIQARSNSAQFQP